MAYKILFFYLFLIHIVVVILLLKTDFVERVSIKFDYSYNDKVINYYINSMYAFQKYQSEQMLGNHNFIIGDSIAQSLSTINVKENVINWGIGHNTSDRLVSEIKDLPSLKRANNIIIIVGINDLASSKKANAVFANFKSIYNNFDATSHIFVVSIIPVSIDRKNAESVNSEVYILNNMLKDHAELNNNVNFIDLDKALASVNGLNKIYDRGDGLHLNTDAYLVLATILNEAVFHAQ